MAKKYTRITWVDEVLTGIAKFLVKNDAGVQVYGASEIALSTPVVTPGTAATAVRMNNIEGMLDNLDDAIDVVYTTGGSSTAFTLTTPQASALATDERWRVKFNATAGAAPTLNRDSKGAKPLMIFDATGTLVACGATTVISGMRSDVVYDGTNYVVIDALPPTVPAVPVKASAAELDTGTDDDKFATALAIAGRAEQGGWIPARQSWTYASATTINVPTDATTLYSVCDKIRFKQGGAWKYFYVTAVAATLLTVTGGSDFTVATPAAITDIYYSKESSPVGFPQYFNYTPTGIAATNVTLSGRFSILGRLCKVDFTAVFTNTITFTTMPTLPITASASYKAWASSYMAVCGQASYIGAAFKPNGMWVTVAPSGTTFTLGSGDGTFMSATSPVTWQNTWGIDAHFSYEI